jgi:hypothetical protein
MTGYSPNVARSQKIFSIRQRALVVPIAFAIGIGAVLVPRLFVHSDQMHVNPGAAGHTKATSSQSPGDPPGHSDGVPGDSAVASLRTHPTAATKPAASEDGASVGYFPKSELRAAETRASQLAELPQGPPPCWRVTGSAPGDFAVRSDRESVWSGTSSVAISAERESSGYGSLVQGSSAKDLRGRRVEYSAMLRTRDVRYGASLWLRADDAEGRPVAFDNLTTSFDSQRRSSQPVDGRIRGNSEWTRQRIVIDIPPTATLIAYGAFLFGGGTVWIDDARIAIVSDDVLTTSPPHIPFGLPSQDPGDSASVPASPQNLDFEIAADSGPARCGRAL